MDADDKKIMDTLLLGAKKELEARGMIPAKMLLILPNGNVFDFEIPDFMMQHKDVLSGVMRTQAKEFKAVAFFFVSDMFLKIAPLDDLEKLKKVGSIKDLPGTVEAILIMYETETVQEAWYVPYERGDKITYKDLIKFESGENAGSLGRFSNILYKPQAKPPFDL